MKLRYFENTAIFVQKFKITDATYQIEGYLEYGACTTKTALPPTGSTFLFLGKRNAAAAMCCTTETKAETAKPACSGKFWVAETTAIDSATTAALIR